MLLRWKREKSEMGSGEISGTKVDDAHITRAGLSEVWVHFFDKMFKDNPNGEWDVAHCDVMEQPWMMLVYPYRSHDMAKDFSRFLRIRFPGQDALMAALGKRLGGPDLDEDVGEEVAELEGAVNVIIGDRILQLATVAAEDYVRTRDLFSRAGMENVRIELWSHGEDCRVVISRDGTKYLAVDD